jgi:endonuclease YncB( thermonuclease family)
MGKRQTLGIQNKHTQNALALFFFVVLTALGCSSFSGTRPEDAAEPPHPTFVPATDGCRPTSERDSARPRVTGTVVAVGDGDTLTIQDGANTRHRIRFFAIDAPESAQEFGSESKEHLSSIVQGKSACVVVIEKDRYGREVGIVYLDGEDINLAQLEAGSAWHYKQHQRKQSETDRSLYDKAEDQARAEKLGLWKEPMAIAPWDYRKVHPPRQ